MHPAARLEWYRLVIDIDEASLAAERQKTSNLDGFLKKK
jgi:hypothetical protein